MSGTIQVDPGGMPIELSPDPNVVIKWNNVASDAIHDTDTGPTVAARTLAIALKSLKLNQTKNPDFFVGSYSSFHVFEPHCKGTALLCSYGKCGLFT